MFWSCRFLRGFATFHTAGGGCFFFSGPQPDPNTFVDASYWRCHCGNQGFGIGGTKDSASLKVVGFNFTSGVFFFAVKVVGSYFFLIWPLGIAGSHHFLYSIFLLRKVWFWPVSLGVLPASWSAFLKLEKSPMTIARTYLLCNVMSDVDFKLNSSHEMMRCLTTEPMQHPVAIWHMQAFQAAYGAARMGTSFYNAFPGLL